MTEESLARMNISRFDRLGQHASPFLLDLLSAVDTPWHEDSGATRAALKRTRQNERLLAWVRSQMLFRLTRVERRAIELYYLERRNYRDAAAEMGVNPSSVHRAVRRGLRKLREEARKSPPRAFRPRRRSAR